VGLAEEDRMGGTCVIRGCVPKKLFVYASRYGDDLSTMQAFGWNVEGARFDWPTLRDNVAKDLVRLEGAYTNTLKNAGVDVFKARAVLKNKNTVLLSTGEEIRAEKILIATGGRSSLPEDLEGVEHALISDDLFLLPVLPKKLIICGGGYIALEFASLYLRLGVLVTLVYRGPRLLKNFEPEQVDMMLSNLKTKGLEVELNTVVKSITKATDGSKTVDLVNGKTFEGAEILFAIGRKPNTQNLGLSACGVKLGDQGEIRVDDVAHTSIPGIYAVGDVTNRVNLTPVAIREGHTLADRLFAGKTVKVDYAHIPSAVFTTPELAQVGLTEQEAAKKYPLLDVYQTAFRPMTTVIAGGETRTMMKIVVDGITDRLLGCHIVGENASEMMQLMAVALAASLTKSQLDATMALHPSASEELVTMRSKSYQIKDGLRVQ
jgi:glutathione reductase (NADPH)